MGLHADPQTKPNTVLDFIDSKKTIKQYATETGIARSTLSDWIKKYHSNLNHDIQENGLPAIIDITNEATDIAIANERELLHSL